MAGKDYLVVRELFERVRAVEWDEAKAASNRRKHGIDFDEAIEVFMARASFVARTATKRSAGSRSVKRKAALSPSYLPGAAKPFGSSRHAQRERMKNERITTRKWGERRKGKTDWAKVDALTDKQIEEAVRNDPDAVPLDVDWSDAVLVIPPKKKAISIRVDEDVLDYFKKQGAGYQRRMNAVLRSFMQQKGKPKKRA
jgi:uncharacterized protein (DUF4415 family)